MQGCIEPEVIITSKHWAPPICDYVNAEIVHANIATLNVQDGRCIQCRCRDRQMQMKCPFEIPRNAKDKSSLLILLSMDGELSQSASGVDTVRKMHTGQLNLTSSLYTNVFIKPNSSCLSKIYEPCFDVHKSKFLVQMFKKMASYRPQKMR
ncbi:hypothetical protein Ae201684P_011024 [Aphanomyces euteiches]|nr:hypothetical protein Ae201684P_011024 [Aphanomyces euteiches]KAH9154261.1 hypothetical protein AeRB84_003611 [Aphanomyces euteiches]